MFIAKSSKLLIINQRRKKVTKNGNGPLEEMDSNKETAVPALAMHHENKGSDQDFRRKFSDNCIYSWTREQQHSRLKRYKEKCIHHTKMEELEAAI
ncbi:hypothetical protein TNCV_429711 [Trichonephila clavipes]|nr:hypothetical protein TNCV_429711 [Trichonephila clavipes]